MNVVPLALRARYYFKNEMLRSLVLVSDEKVSSELLDEYLECVMNFDD
jgi:hypothetical protein